MPVKHAARRGSSSRGGSGGRGGRGDRSPSPPPPQPGGLSFVDQLHETRFKNDFSKRKVMKGKSVQLDHFREFGLLDLFEKNHLLRLIDIELPCYDILVQQFYANLSGYESGAGFVLSSIVGTTVININQNHISHIFGLTNNGNIIPTISTTKWVRGIHNDENDLHEDLQIQTLFQDPNVPTLKPSAKNLPVPVRVAHRVMQSNIIPRGGHQTDVTYVDIYVLAHMIAELPFNFTNLIMRLMIHAATTPSIILPFGRALTRLFLACNVNLNPYNGTPLHPINDYLGPTNLNKMNLRIVNGIYVSRGGYRGAAQPPQGDREEGDGEEIGDEEEFQNVGSQEEFVGQFQSDLGGGFSGGFQEGFPSEFQGGPSQSPYQPGPSHGTYQSGPSQSQSHSLDDLYDLMFQMQINQNERFDHMDTRLDAMGNQIDGINTHLQGYDARFTNLEESYNNFFTDFYNRFPGLPGPQ